jgi:uracil-DNA glycosylase
MEYRIKDIFSHIKTNWKDDIQIQDIISRYANDIDTFLNKEATAYEGALQIFPPKNYIFEAFNHFDIEKLKVVVIGQDPYQREGLAHGLSFSVPKGSKCPPSLNNVFKELHREYGQMRCNTDLTDWASAGVLLLNRALTVRENCPMSHMKIWRNFTEDILKYISKRCSHVVYILWGQNAMEITKYINQEENLVLASVHPSPLAQLHGKSFVGNGHFHSANTYLKKHMIEPITWV